MLDRASIYYYVALIGTDNTATPIDLTSRVQSFVLTDSERGMDKLVLTVDNKDLANFDDPAFEYGAKLRVAFGNGRAASPTRDMVIRKVTGGRVLTVEAATKNGALLDTIKKRRRFETARRSDVVRQIAQENGFTLPDIEETEEVHPVISQSNLTDAQLLRKLASLEGFEFYIDYDGIHWHRRRVGQAPAREYIYFSDPEGGEIIDFNVENDVTRRPGRVTVKSRDPISKEDITASASNADDPDRDVMAGYAGTVDGEEGTLTIKPEIAHETTVASNAQTQADAVREAKGKYRKTQQGVVKLTLTLRGDPSLVAKVVVRVTNIGKRISGLYYVTEVTHNLDAGGGYEMVAKLITDGFQHHGKKNAGTDSASASSGLTAVSKALLAAIDTDVTAVVAGETGQLDRSVEAIQQLISATHAADRLVKAVAKQTGDEQKMNALKVAQKLTTLVSFAARQRAPSIATAAANAAAICQRIGQSPDQIKAKGKKNNKAVGTGDVKPVKTVNADNQPVTTYVNTGGREK